MPPEQRVRATVIEIVNGDTVNRIGPVEHAPCRLRVGAIPDHCVGLADHLPYGGEAAAATGGDERRDASAVIRVARAEPAHDGAGVEQRGTHYSR